MFDLSMDSRSGGRTITGQEQVVASDAGFWAAQISFTVVRKTHGTRRAELEVAWRAMRAYMQGRTNAFLIGPYARGSSPAALAGDPYGPFNIPHDDGSFFDDGAGYDQSGTPAHVRDAAAVGATSINVVMEAGQVPEPGQYFGRGGDRLYLIASVSDLGDDEYTMTFVPRLRAAAAAGDPVEFDDPVCLMRLSKDSAAALTVKWKSATTPSLDLVEASPEP